MNHKKANSTLKSLIIIVSVMCVLPLMLFPVIAKNSVPDMQITVELQPNGDARITQIWTGSFHEGTEVYLPIENLGDMDVTELAVSDAHGAYENIGAWDIDASFEQKARKCGIVTTDEGYELCFGISEYGSNTYTFSYTVTGLVGRYSDGVDGFLFQFVNPGMSIYPTNVVLRIIAPNGILLSSQNSGIWAFGYEGTILFDNGTVVARTDLPLEEHDGSSCIILLRLDAGLLDPHRESSMSFEKLKENAFEGSAYEKKFDVLTFIFIIIFVTAWLALVVYAIYRGVLRSQARRHIKRADYYRDIPCGGDLGVSYAMAKPFGMSHGQSLLSASLLRMISHGNIATSQQPDSPQKAQMTFIHEPAKKDKLLYSLYRALVGACPEGSNTVTEKQLKKHITDHFTPIEAALNTAESFGRKALREYDCYTKPKKSDQVHNLKDLTPAGIAVLDQLAGFNNYLRDFTLIDERTTFEVALWKEYLVYATLLEAADTVIEELRRLAPYYDMTATTELESFDNSFTCFLMLNSVLHSSYKAGYSATHSANSNGSGGGSSFGGGGGFSGGGFGGGTR